jgi:transcriptional regulator with XRE-family HTH domain
MSGEQVTFENLDISGQLRMIMAAKRLTVAELARAAGVSKSAMEKYLAGPSSPRATAIASLCANLDLSVEWLLFGYSTDDAHRVRDLAMNVIFQLIQDLKNPGPTHDHFEALVAGSRDFNGFALEVASSLSHEIGTKLWKARRRDMRYAAEGAREATLDPIPFQDQAAEASEK